MMRKIETALTKTLLGETRAMAVTLVMKTSFVCRITRIDGNQFVTIMDMRDDRINLEIDNGRVTKAYIG